MYDRFDTFAPQRAGRVSGESKSLDELIKEKLNPEKPTENKVVAGPAPRPSTSQPDLEAMEWYALGFGTANAVCVFFVR